MPRPGYEPEEDTLPNEGDLLSRFDPEARTELARRIAEGSITQAHVIQLYRLMAASPEDRDADALTELLDEAEGMDSSDLAKWIDDRIARWRDQ